MTSPVSEQCVRDPLGFVRLAVGERMCAVLDGCASVHSKFVLYDYVAASDTWRVLLFRDTQDDLFVVRGGLASNLSGSRPRGFTGS